MAAQHIEAFSGGILAVGGAAGGQQGGGLFMFGPMLIILLLFYLMIIRPQMRKEKERRKMLENLQSGARVLFSGGIIGTITNVKERTFVVKIADNVKIEIARGAVLRVLAKDEDVADVGTQS